jgi:hypothetical protein
MNKNLPAQLPDTLPGPSGYLPGCSVSHPVENLPVFLPDTLPGPSGYLPGCSFFSTHYFIEKKSRQIISERPFILLRPGFLQHFIYIYIYILIYI